MTRFITHAIGNGTKVQLAISGSSVDAVMRKVRRYKLKSVRECKVFMFYNRTNGKLVESRIN